MVEKSDIPVIEFQKLVTAASLSKLVVTDLEKLLRSKSETRIQFDGYAYKFVQRQSCVGILRLVRHNSCYITNLKSLFL